MIYLCVFAFSVFRPDFRTLPEPTHIRVTKRKQIHTMFVAVNDIAVSHFPKGLTIIFRYFPEDDAFSFQIWNFRK